MTADAAVRLKRLRIRSWRRGTREMDLILGGFADATLQSLNREALEAFEILLSENDQELYQWIAGQCKVPARHEEIVARIRRHHRIG
jgi:antitoxin CptB